MWKRYAMEVWNDLLFRFDFVIWRPRKSTLHLLLTYLFLLIQNLHSIYILQENIYFCYTVLSQQKYAIPIISRLSFEAT